MKGNFFLGCLILLCNILFSQEKETSFTLCDDGSTYPYYSPELKYKGGFWEIKQNFISEYPTNQFQELKNNSGIIIIQFKVNCKGEVGDFSVQQLDLSYQPTVLAKEITKYFLTTTKMLKNWVPAKNEEGKFVNSHKFFSFKINKGVLLEILPK